MPERRTSLATVLAALLVVVGVLAAALSGPLSLEARPYHPPMEEVVPTVFPSVDPPPPAPEDVEFPPPAAWADWFVRVIQVLAVLLVATVVALLLRQATRGWRFDRSDDGGEDADPGDDTGETLSDTAVAALREGVQEATRALEDDVPPGDAVIGAWVAVETAAARTGVVRDRAETASEFAVRVLDATRADPAATRELLRLYLAARFGSHGVDADDVRRARDLLRVVGQGLVARTDAEGAATPAEASGPASAGTAPAGGGATP